MARYRQQQLITGPNVEPDQSRNVVSLGRSGFKKPFPEWR